MLDAVSRRHTRILRYALHAGPTMCEEELSSDMRSPMSSVAYWMVFLTMDLCLLFVLSFGIEYFRVFGNERLSRKSAFAGLLVSIVLWSVMATVFLWCF